MQLTQAPIRLRLVQADDCRLFWEWANDPDVRQRSFVPEPIPWEQHVRWFNAKLASPHCIIYVALGPSDAPIGQVRYDIDGASAVLSVSVARQFRGQGYGSVLLQRASHQLFESTPVCTIHAYVKQDNAASVHAFVKAGFTQKDSIVMQGCHTLHLILQKEETS